MGRLGPYELDTIVVGDCLDVMRQMPDGCVDLVIADPPYGIGYASSWKKRHSGEPREAQSTFGADDFDGRWITEAARLLDDDGALYLFTRWDVLHLWHKAINATGMKVSQRLVWDKRHWGMGDLRYFGSQTEDILFCPRPDHRLRWEKRQGNLLSVWGAEMWYQGGHSGHPTEKARSLIERLIVLSSDADGVVADFHMGSGTTAVAACRQGRHFFGCDISEEYVSMARGRLAAVQARLM